MQAKPSTPTGIRKRHSRSCPARTSHEGRCNCKPSYEAWVYSARDHRKISKRFRALAEAKAWRHDASTSVRRGTMRAPVQTTLRAAWEAWLAGAEEGTIRTRSGDPYKPSVIRSYRQVMELRVLDDLGAAKLGDVGRPDLQDFADHLRGGLDASTVRNALMPLRAIYRRALSRGEVAVNPTSGLELPAVRGKRELIASPAEAAALIEALPESDRALWATALYAGLRRAS
jgi:integrase